jgi:LysM repeat protein
VVCGYPSTLNACRKASPPQPVALSHQEQVCLAGHSAGCPVLAEGFIGPLPSHLREKTSPNANLQLVVYRTTIILAILFVLVGGGYTLYTTGLAATLLAPIPTPDLRGQSWLVSSNTPRPTEAPTLDSARLLLRPSATTLPSTFSPSPSPALSSRSSVTPTLLVPSAVADANDTILGPHSEFVVHVVRAGDTINALLKTYRLSLPVIRKLNPVLEFAGLQVDMAVVILPGRQDPQGLQPMQAVKLLRDTPVATFVRANQTNLPLLQASNRPLPPTLPAGLWLLIPRPEKTPTPTPTASPTRTPTATPTITPTQLTPGPGLNKPFGPDGKYLVHITVGGESIEYLSAQFKTSPDVIKKVNFSANQFGLWVDTPLIVLPGQKDEASAVPMQAVWIDQAVAVSDFIKKYQVDESTFRWDNGIIGDQVQASRWVVFLRKVK